MATRSPQQPANGTRSATDIVTLTQQIDAAGGVVSGAGDNSSVDATGSTVPANATFVAGTDGTNTRALKTDSGGELQIDVLSLPALAAGSALVGNVGLDPRTSGGLSIATDIDLDETELEVKATAGQIYGWYIYNDGAAEVYVKLYNATAANVTVGSTVPVMTLGIPAGAGANVEFAQGIAFSTAICAAATTVATTADATAPAANQVVANFLYK